jgi:hypothetical protein
MPPTKKKPIYVNDPNDSRLQAYNDSLTLYNFYNKQRKLESIKDILPFTRNPNRDNNQKELFNDAKRIVNTNPNIKFGISGLTKQKTEQDYKISGSPDILHKTIKPDGTWMGEGANNNYSNVNPEQPYIYKKLDKKEKKEEKKRTPIETTDKRKVQSYNDSLFIKKNFNIFPRPKGYNEALKRVGQDPSADYFPNPVQPYVLKKEEKKKENKKKDIVPAPIKELILKDTVSKDTVSIVKPKVEKQLESKVVKKLPGGSGKFAQYPNMKSQLGNLKTFRMVNSKKVQNIVPTFAEGTKNIKKYQFGEDNLNLPIRYVKKNDPRIQASADSIYAYNTTRGDSPAIIAEAYSKIQGMNEIQKMANKGIQRDPKYKKAYLESIEESKKEIKKIKASKPNDQPVKPGAFGSKVIINKNKKPSFGAYPIQDPELKRIQKKNKPIHYLSEERYADNPLGAISTVTNIPHKKTPITGTQRHRIQKPVTSKIESYPNLNKAKKIYPEITDKENSEILEKINKDVNDSKDTYYNPNSYYNPTQKNPWGTDNPNEPFAEYDENSKFKKHGFQIEDIVYDYHSSKSEIPKFAKPKYKWLPKEEEEKIKKEEEEKKEEIIPKEPEKTPKETPQETPKEEPKKETKLPGGTGSFARYPKKQGFFNKIKDSFTGLMQDRKVNSRDVNNITVTGPSFVSGAKSVKQYRGDENLPEAKKGMKNCGCKHSKSKYKYQDGSKNVTSKEDYMDYLNLIKDKLSKSSNYYDFILNSYKKDYRHPELNNRYIVDKELESKEKPVEKKEEKPIEKPIKKPSQILPRRRTGVSNTKHSFKYGAGALTIPEGSAIVTANGGKNKQALMAYKKGNYKLLNNIIEDMPEDNVDKAQAGIQSTKVGGLTSFDIKASKKGKAKNRLDMTRTAQDEIWQGENYENKWKPEVDKAINDPQQYAKVLEYFKNYQGQDKETVQKILSLAETKSPAEVKYAIKKLGKDGNIGPFHTILKEAMGSGGNGGSGTTPVPPPGTIPTSPPTTPPGDEYEEVISEDIKPSRPVMSAAETSTIAGVLGQGVPRGPKESYLKLNKYNYASQLPKTLQENSLAAQAGMEKSRDIVGGDAGRYLAQAGNITAGRMKLNNEAVIADTLARQDILNKNVDLSNTELTTNRSLKDYYDDIKRQNTNDYNALLVKGGQSFDESFDNYQKMKNENQNTAQQLQLLKEANPNYTMVRDPKTGLMKSAYRYKKVNKGTSQTPTQFLAPANTNNTLSGENLDFTTTDPNNPPTMFYKKGMKRAKTYKRK